MKTKHDEVTLGGCYHTGLAYSLGYYPSDNNDEIELSGETFTNFNTGLNGGARAALLEHRKNFDPSRDLPRFIVALKPVEIISPPNEHDCCSAEDDDDICGDCGNYFEDCICCCEDCYDDPCDSVDIEIINVTVINEETIIPPLNAFARARWLKEGK